MVRNESPKSNEEILKDLVETETKINEELEKLAEEVVLLEKKLDDAIIGKKPEEIIYPLQDKVIEAKEKLGNAIRERDQIIAEKDKIAMKQTGIYDHPPHQ